MKAAHPEVAAATRINPGETLRQARESKQWSLAEVAQKLNLTVTALGNLEAGSFDKLPGNTFARGYIRAYAKLLDMDQNPLVQQFDLYTGTDATGSSVQALGRIVEPVRLSHNILRFVSFLLLVAVLGGGFAIWQDKAGQHEAEQPLAPMSHVVVDNSDGTTQVHPLDGPEEPVPLAGQKPADAPVTPAPAGTEAVAPGTATPAPDSAPATAVEPAHVPAVAPSAAAALSSNPALVTKPAVSAPVVPVKPVVPAAAPVQSAPAPGDGSLSLLFSADCWVQVIDGNDKVILSGLKHGGDTVGVSGKPPLKLRLGVAHAVQVTYNGQPVNVAPYTSGDTARITLGH